MYVIIYLQRPEYGDEKLFQEDIVTQYTFTVKLTLENEMRPEILEAVVGNAMRSLNVNVFPGPEQHPAKVDVKGKKG